MTVDIKFKSKQRDEKFLCLIFKNFIVIDQLIQIWIASCTWKIGVSQQKTSNYLFTANLYLVSFVSNIYYFFTLCLLAIYKELNKYNKPDFLFFQNINLINLKARWSFLISSWNIIFISSFSSLFGHFWSNSNL